MFDVMLRNIENNLKKQAEYLQLLKFFICIYGNIKINCKIINRDIYVRQLMNKIELK
jgi:hypothetical protein